MPRLTGPTAESGLRPRLLFCAALGLVALILGAGCEQERVNFDAQNPGKGSPMPIDPLEGVRTLTDAELADLQTWIINGAVDE